MSETMQNRRSDRIRKIESELKTKNEIHKMQTPRKRHISTESRSSSISSRQNQKTGYY